MNIYVVLIGRVCVKGCNKVVRCNNVNKWGCHSIPGAVFQGYMTAEAYGISQFVVPLLMICNEGIISPGLPFHSDLEGTRYHHSGAQMFLRCPHFV